MTSVRSILWFAGLLAGWELVGRFGLVGGGALPAPGAIAARFWADAPDYPPHVLATLQAAAGGFLLGSAVAVLAGLCFSLWPAAAALARGLNVAVFALPPIAVVPILVLCLPGTWPRIVLAALGCYFPVMTATVLGLAQADPRAIDLVHAYGGGAGAVLRLVRWRGALPVVLSSFRVAAPNAVLGAILAEFGGGGRTGLGTYLIGSLGRADPPLFDHWPRVETACVTLVVSTPWSSRSGPPGRSLALQLRILENPESMGNHDSGSDEWRGVG